MRLLLMTTGRWMVCIAVCAIFLSVGMAYHRWVVARTDVIFQVAHERAEPPPDEEMVGVVFGIPSGMMKWIELDQLMMKFWFVLLPLVFLVGFGIAWSIPWKPGIARAQAAPPNGR